MNWLSIPSLPILAYVGTAVDYHIFPYESLFLITINGIA